MLISWFLVGAFAAADKAADDAWRALKSREEYDADRAKLREMMIDAIGGPGGRASPRAATFQFSPLRGGAFFGMICGE